MSPPEHVDLQRDEREPRSQPRTKGGQEERAEARLTAEEPEAAAGQMAAHGLRNGNRVVSPRKRGFSDKAVSATSPPWQASRRACRARRRGKRFPRRGPPPPAAPSGPQNP